MGRFEGLLKDRFRANTESGAQLNTVGTDRRWFEARWARLLQEAASEKAKSSKKVSCRNHD